jgi:hypothetical protein
MKNSNVENNDRWRAAPWNQADLRLSELCKTIDFEAAWYHRWCKEIKETPRIHRKQWEYTYILQALFERDCLRSGKRGLGFAVGTEPLPSVMAKYGCEIMATDLDYASGQSKGWDSGDQLCFGLDSLNQRQICAPDVFRKRVQYQPVDMNAMPSTLRDYDFNWSSCSFEHLGSLTLGLNFLKNQMNTLKPGGWAVHTTEFNVSSERDTIVENPNTVIFRRQEIEFFAKWARKQGHYVEELDFSIGNLPTDFHVDQPPFASEPHLRLLLQGYVVTSIGLIIRKGKRGIWGWFPKMGNPQ